MFQAHSLKARRNGRLVFREITFDLGAGEVLLVNGANGSGKSSLLRVLAGLIPASDGALSWHGTAVTEDWVAHRQRLHYIGHLDALKPELTPHETLDYWRTLGTALPGTITDVLIAVGLHDKSDRQIRYLSAGQKRRLTLARLALYDAPLWLLDEPTTALDQNGQDILQNLIAAHRAKGGMAIIATHHAIDITDAAELRL